MRSRLVQYQRVTTDVMRIAKGGPNFTATSCHQYSGLNTTRLTPATITLPLPSITEMVGFGVRFAAKSSNNNHPADKAPQTMDSGRKTLMPTFTALSLPQQLLIAHYRCLTG